MSSTTCFQNTSNNWTFSGTPRNLRTGEPSFSLPLLNLSSDVSVVGVSMLDLSDSTTDVAVAGVGGAAHASTSDVGEVGEAARYAPFSRTRAFCVFTFSANRRAAASSWRLVSSGSSFSASRAA